MTRRFQLTIPTGYTGRRPLPVVLGLHVRSTVDYRFVAGMVGFGDMNKRDHYIAGVVPSALLDGRTPVLARSTVGRQLRRQVLQRPPRHARVRTVRRQSCVCSRQACRTVRRCRRCSCAGPRTASPWSHRSPASSSTTSVRAAPFPSSLFMAPPTRSSPTRAGDSTLKTHREHQLLEGHGAERPAGPPRCRRRDAAPGPCRWL